MPNMNGATIGLTIRVYSMDTQTDNCTGVRLSKSFEITEASTVSRSSRIVSRSVFDDSSTQETARNQ